MTYQPDSGLQKALVVDDHLISRQYVAAALESFGLTVQRARTAEQALEAALAWRPDLICMDYLLPDGNGLAASLEIRARWPDGCAQPVILLLSGGDSGLLSRGPAPDCVDRILSKPLTARELREAVMAGGTAGAAETGPKTGTVLLRDLFHEELAQRLPELERALLSDDLATASGILHQLIASSAMCREERLELDLRDLDRACRTGGTAAEIARGCYAVLASAREFLGR